MRKLSDAAPPGCRPLQDYCIDNQPVLILDGPNAGRKGTIAHPWDPNDGNKESRAFAALGLTSKTVPSQHLVVEIDDDSGRCDVVVHYSSVHLVNQELQTYLERANREDPDVGALRTLGHCLTEGNGGIGQDMINGGSWLAYGLSFDDGYCKPYTLYVMGMASRYPRNPHRFNTMEDVEAWFTTVYG